MINGQLSRDAGNFFSYNIWDLQHVGIWLCEEKPKCSSSFIKKKVHILICPKINQKTEKVIFESSGAHFIYEG